MNTEQYKHISYRPHPHGILTYDRDYKYHIVFTDAIESTAELDGEVIARVKAGEGKV